MIADIYRDADAGSNGGIRTLQITEWSVLHCVRAHSIHRCSPYNHVDILASQSLRSLSALT